MRYKVIMIPAWVKNVISVIRPEQVSAQTSGQGAQAFERKARAELIDVAEGVKLSEEAQRKGAELLSKLQMSGAPFVPLTTGAQVRSKVKKGISDFYDFEDVVDEVTEKLKEVSKADPFYKRLFR